MNLVDARTLRNATDMVDDNRTLERALREWFHHKGSCPDPDIVNFWEWVCRRLEEMAGHLPSDMPVEDWRLVKALEVNAIGDRLAVRLAKNAKRRGFKSDISCYVEEGMVYASVWIAGKTAKEAEAYGDRIENKFMDAGYSPEMWIDPEDSTEVTVNACIDFSEYLKGSKKGGR